MATYPCTIGELSPDIDTLKGTAANTVSYAIVAQLGTASTFLQSDAVLKLPTALSSLTTPNITLTFNDNGTYSAIADGRNALTIQSQITDKIGFWGKTPVSQPAAYTISNATGDRAFDAAATTLTEIANVLGTLITDLKGIGLVG